MVALLLALVTHRRPLGMLLSLLLNMLSMLRMLSVLLGVLGVLGSMLCSWRVVVCLVRLRRVGSTRLVLRLELLVARIVVALCLPSWVHRPGCIYVRRLR